MFHVAEKSNVESEPVDEANAVTQVNFFRAKKKKKKKLRPAAENDEEQTLK